jgi:hypothetical protein
MAEMDAGITRCRDTNPLWCFLTEYRTASFNASGFSDYVTTTHDCPRPLHWWIY